MHIHFLHHISLELTSYDLPKRLDNVAFILGNHMKAMAPHSSTLAWKILWTEEPGRLQSMGSLRVGHDFTFTFHSHALEKEMATHSSVFAWRIPGMGDLVGCHLWGRTVLDTTEVT